MTGTQTPRSDSLPPQTTDRQPAGDAVTIAPTAAPALSDVSAPKTADTTANARSATPPHDASAATRPTTAASLPEENTVSGSDSLMGTASLSGPDSLLASGLFFSDDLGHAHDSLPATTVAEPAFRNVAPQEVFGAASFRAAGIPVPSPATAPARPLPGTPAFEILVLLLTAAYAIFLYRHLNDIVLLFRRIFHTRASHERLTESSGSGNNMLRFLNIAAVFGLLFLGAATIKCVDTLLPAEIPEAWPRELLAVASLLATALWALIAVYQSLLLKTVGTVTLAMLLTDQIWMLKRTYFALAAIFALPLFLLLALVPSDLGTSWLYITAIGLAITAILCLRETSQLFLVKKIPILYWFLYLCIVEIFPFSLLWLLAIR